ncbi:MAG TPA: ATP synthase F0 subunit B [bacterium]|nr:ATP synthase F0 subunit B [bacterium]
MISFDPTLFLLQALLFPVFLFLFGRWVFDPIQGVLAERDRRLNREGTHADEASRTLAELKERYRREMETVHRAGMALVAEAKERAEREARTTVEKVSDEMHEMVAAEQEAARQQCGVIFDEIRSHRGDLEEAIADKLWGRP